MRKPLAIAVLTLLGSNAFAAGEVYRWKDASGTWNYSDQPHPGAERIRGVPAASNAAAAPAAAPAAPAAPAPANNPLPVSKEVAQQVRQDAATAKAKNCEKLTADYTEKLQALRMTRKDEKGNVSFLTAEEMDAVRLQVRAAKDLACGP
jgi:hypothetical protein